MVTGTKNLLGWNRFTISRQGCKTCWTRSRRPRHELLSLLRSWRGYCTRLRSHARSQPTVTSLSITDQRSSTTRLRTTHKMSCPSLTTRHCTKTRDWRRTRCSTFFTTDRTRINSGWRHVRLSSNHGDSISSTRHGSSGTKSPSRLQRSMSRGHIASLIMRVHGE